VTIAYLGLGGNLGDREASLQQAAEALDWGPARLLRSSRLYETEPIGGPVDQPWFLNQVVEVETRMQPGELLDRCMAIENALGRRRASETRWGPRIIDIDVLLFGDLELNTGGLTIPHPRLYERAFALVPLAELAPDLVPPGRKETIAQLAAAIDDQAVRAL
jgi:2-amino-4-hydroxy-6-hydroxymethyldihydropteridine diphosphokinase